MDKDTIAIDLTLLEEQIGALINWFDNGGEINSMDMDGIYGLLTAIQYLAENKTTGILFLSMDSMIERS